MKLSCGNRKSINNALARSSSSWLSSTCTVCFFFFSSPEPSPLCCLVHVIYPKEAPLCNETLHLVHRVQWCLQIEPTEQLSHNLLPATLSSTEKLQRFPRFEKCVPKTHPSTVISIVDIGPKTLFFGLYRSDSRWIRISFALL